MGDSVFVKLFGEESQKVPDLITSILPLNYLVCGQMGRKKANCPKIRCFYCGKMGHAKKTCLNCRLVKMYNEEKGVNSSFSSNNSHNTFLSCLNTLIPTKISPLNSCAPSSADPMEKEDLLEYRKTRSNSIGHKNPLDSSQIQSIGSSQTPNQVSPIISAQASDHTFDFWLSILRNYKAINRKMVSLNQHLSLLTTLIVHIYSQAA